MGLGAGALCSPAAALGCSGAALGGSGAGTGMGLVGRLGGVCSCRHEGSQGRVARGGAGLEGVGGCMLLRAQIRLQEGQGWGDAQEPVHRAYGKGVSTCRQGGQRQQGQKPTAKPAGKKKIGRAWTIFEYPLCLPSWSSGAH